jgi:hypothetical protein
MTRHRKSLENGRRPDMTEKTLRRFHRAVGMPLALFVIVQIGTGTLLSVEDLLGRYWGGLLQDVHHQYGISGDIYRIIVGVGILWMAATGFAIAMKIRARTKKGGAS